MTLSEWMLSTEAVLTPYRQPIVLLHSLPSPSSTTSYDYRNQADKQIPKGQKRQRETWE